MRGGGVVVVLALHDRRFISGEDEALAGSGEEARRSEAQASAQGLEGFGELMECIFN